MQHRAAELALNQGELYIKTLDLTAALLLAAGLLLSATFRRSSTLLVNGLLVTFCLHFTITLSILEAYYHNLFFKSL